jgi:hypothetical protein
MDRLALGIAGQRVAAVQRGAAGSNRKTGGALAVSIQKP